VSNAFDWLAEQADRLMEMFVMLYLLAVCAFAFLSIPFSLALIAFALMNGGTS
jgi:hypothetical protein